MDISALVQKPNAIENIANAIIQEIIASIVIVKIVTTNPQKIVTQISIQQMKPQKTKKRK